MKVSFAFQTHKGKVRSINEDYFGYWKDKLFIVADGLGGHAAGEVASRLAVNEVIRKIKSESMLNRQTLENAIQSANQLLFKTATANPQYFGMGTTLVSLLISQDTLIVSSVGDSLALILRDKEIKQVTDIDRDYFGFLTQAVGLGRSLSINTVTLKAKSQDLILLTTDGLTDLVSQDAIQATLESQVNLNKKAATLIKLALQQGGHDNITVCTLKLI